MRVLVTGGGGFAGRHLVRLLANRGHVPVVSDNSLSAEVEGAADSIPADLRDPSAVDSMVARAKAESCVHLGAVSYVPAGSGDPTLMFGVNVLGTLNVLEAFRRRSADARILVVSSARVYKIPGDDHALTEDEMLEPSSTYGASKAAADLMALGYARSYDMQVMTVRPNNHTGPGQSPSFVTASLAAQVAAAPKGSSVEIETGNLESERHFLDVRDVVRAYLLLLEKGRAGEAYNLSSRKRVKIGGLLGMLGGLAGVKPLPRADSDRQRPTDRSPNLNVEKLVNDTGWSAEIEFEQTLNGMLGALQ
ncbi:MAG: GDP-mannose 4,6-dehydratase [Kiritimatiellia bacterium]